MNILKESILIRRRFHDFQKFTSREEDISIRGFLKKELSEWDQLSEDSKNSVVKAYRNIIEISSRELPVII